MNKKFWLTLLILLAFMFTIQMIYITWFGGHPEKDAIQSIEKAGQDINSLIKTLEATESTIDSAITGINKGKEEISLLSSQVEASDSAYYASLQEADLTLEEMRVSFESRKTEIENLRKELIKLK